MVRWGWLGGLALVAALLGLGCDDGGAGKKVSPGDDAGLDASSVSDSTFIPAIPVPDAGELIRDVDNEVIRELCEAARADRLTRRPGDARLIEIGCVAMISGGGVPESVEACEEAQAECIADADGMVLPDVNVAFDYQLDCDAWVDYEGAITFGQLDACWMAVNERLEFLVEAISCEKVLEEGTEFLSIEPEECALLAAVDIPE